MNEIPLNEWDSTKMIGISQNEWDFTKMIDILKNIRDSTKMIDISTKYLIFDKPDATRNHPSCSTFWLIRGWLLVFETFDKTIRLRLIAHKYPHFWIIFSHLLPLRMSSVYPDPTPTSFPPQYDDTFNLMSSHHEMHPTIENSFIPTRNQPELVSNEIGYENMGTQYMPMERIG